MKQTWEWELEVENSVGDVGILQLDAEFELSVGEAADGTGCPSYSVRNLWIRGHHEGWDDEVRRDFYQTQLQKIIDRYEAEEAQNGSRE